MQRARIAIVASLLVAGSALADVRQSAPDGFAIVHEVRVDAPPSRVYEAIADIGGWWSGTHTYSGRAANLSLALEPGGCFCERWSEGAVAHGRVLMAWRDRVVRLDAPLGPLQAKAVSAVLALGLKPSEGGTLLTLTYRVTGASISALDKDAAAVDQVLGEQVARLRVRAETGKPPL